MASPKLPRQRELLSPCIRPEFTQVGRSASGFFWGVPNEGNRANVAWNKATWRVDFGISSLWITRHLKMQFVLVVGLLCLKCVRWFFSPWSWGVIFCLNMFSNGVVTLPAGVSFVSFSSLWLFLKISSELVIKSSIGFSSLKMVIAQVLTPVIFFRQFSRLIVYLYQKDTLWNMFQKWSQRSRCLHRVVLEKKQPNGNAQINTGFFGLRTFVFQVLIDFYWFLARINSLQPGDIVLKLFRSRTLDQWEAKEPSGWHGEFVTSKNCPKPTPQKKNAQNQCFESLSGMKDCSGKFSYLANGQLSNFFGVTCLVGKQKFKLLFHGLLAE